MNETGRDAIDAIVYDLDGTLVRLAVDPQSGTGEGEGAEAAAAGGGGA
jgi:hypothetical protein